MRISFYLALVVIFTAAGCGSNDRQLQYIKLVQQNVWGGGGDQNSLRSKVSPKILSQVGRPVIYTEAQKLGSELLFVEDLRNGDNVSWVSPTNEMITLKGGVVVSTRGAGHDLISSDVSDVLSALLQHRLNSERIHWYLDGQNHIEMKSFFCEYEWSQDSTSAYFSELPATRVVENCFGTEQDFTNQYWISSSGEVVRSSQWVSPGIGHISYERLTSWAAM